MKVFIDDIAKCAFALCDKLGIKKPSHREMFAGGYREGLRVNPWHKTSEELPPYDKIVLVAYNGNTDECCFNHRSNNPEMKTTQHGWYYIDGKEPTHWMPIPEIKED